MRRREALAAVAVGSGLLSGCIWGDEETTATPDDERPADNETTAAPEEPPSNASERPPSPIQSVTVTGTDLVVRIAEERQSAVREVRLSTPEDTTTQTRADAAGYTLNVADAAVGTWTVTAVGADGEVLDTATYEATVGVEVTDIETLAQLGVSASQRYQEYLTLQFTLENVGDVPVEPVKFAFGTSFKRELDIGYNPVGEDHDRVLDPGDRATFRSAYNISRFFLGYDDIHRYPGETKTARLLIYWSDRAPTRVPLRIEYGETVREIGPAHVIPGTAVYKRE